MTREFRSIDIGDAKLHVEIAGVGAPLIMLAGLGGRGAFWGNQVSTFSQGHQVIVPDHRGCGGSTRGQAVASIALMAEDFLTMMDKMNIASANLVGHSTGGAIGQYLAIHHPERLQKLVISSSWAGPDPYFKSLFDNRVAILTNCGAEAYLWNGTFLAMPPLHLQSMLASGHDLVADRLEEFPGLEVELTRIGAVLGHDLRARLSEISMPTLCIVARDDQITPAVYSEEIAAAIPGAKLRVLDRGGHFCPAVCPDEYNQQIADFLAE